MLQGNVLNTNGPLAHYNTVVLTHLEGLAVMMMINIEYSTSQLPDHLCIPSVINIPTGQVEPAEIVVQSSVIHIGNVVSAVQGQLKCFPYSDHVSHV